MAKRTAKAKQPRVRKAVDSALEKKPSQKMPQKSRRRVAVLSPLAKIFSPLRILLPSYFVNSWREMRQVTWPNRRETWRLTAAVFIFAIIFGSLVAGVDRGLDEIFKKLILK